MVANNIARAASSIVVAALAAGVPVAAGVADGEVLGAEEGLGEIVQPLLAGGACDADIDRRLAWAESGVRAVAARDAVLLTRHHLQSQVHARASGAS